MRYITANVGGVLIGHDEPIVVQSMCNSNTDDIDASVAQCRQLHEAGARIVRLTTQGLKEVESLAVIKKRLRDEGISVPLVADVHFSSEVAIAAAAVADKVRINPGNFAKDHDTARTQFKRFIAECAKHGTAIRIGINHGSLGARITELYGNTPKGMQQAMSEWVEMCMEENFHNVVLSLKASNVPVMVEAYQLLYGWMKEKGVIFPLHLGVTEAGNGDMGRIKSAAGLAALLSQGIGDTIRVSLTEPPVNETAPARIIARFFDCHERPEDYLVSTDCGVPSYRLHCGGHEEFITKASCIVGPMLLNKEIDDFNISCSYADKDAGEDETEQFKSDIMQATRRRMTQCEYIACPSCGRTMYDIESVFNEVKRRTSHLRGLTIAVMGCIVNGPGEMADADYGYIGEGRDKVSIYRGREAVIRSVPPDKAIDMLLRIIEEDGRNTDGRPRS
ncbi:MAG TPA: (E)-4-hydroxy-3-methylbut-2-enyl-diphosphate synthase [Candidatus Coprenecus stercoravium]|uniref:4-hydroxy-3-methylbut-2-en-1-yl diphosphate synthase (flavodoxin) n=1 Tax=Candidatus Coprenecus stercoravium TaxID=2840735 RepID=A0A9D2K920_9BACT|nr:(E)-4-hydroxy-3-methylbut-2-enyl-diphosphate synthase [Candidatus Coprenecus stercoravium]